MTLQENNTLLCAVCMLLCMVPCFAVLPGVLIYVFIHGGVNCLNSVPYRCYMYVYIIAIGSIGQLSDCSCMSL